MRLGRARFLFYLLPIAILLLAFFLRVDKLTTLPPGLSYDEATSTVDAYLIGHSGSFPLYEDLGRPEPLYQALLALNMLLLGHSVFVARLFSAFVGALTIATAYWAACQCLHDLPVATRRLAGLTAAAALTVSLGHITLSRALYRGILQPPFMFLYIGFLLQGLRTRRHRALILAGICLGATLYTYTAAISLPLSLIAVGISLLIFRIKCWREWLPLILLVGAVTALALIPLGLRFLDRPQSVTGRMADVGSGSGVTQDSFVPKLLSRLPAFVAQFYKSGDINPQYNSDSAPLLPPVFSILGGIGLLALLIRIRAPSTALIAALFVLAALPVLAAGEVPHGLRVMGEFAVFPLIVAAGAALIVRVLQPARITLALLNGALILLVIGAGYGAHRQYETYFEQPLTWSIYGETLSTFEWFFRTDRYELARWLAVQPDPLLVPTDELNEPTTHTWLLTGYPDVTAADAGFAVPEKARFVVPWALELGDLRRQTKDYALLQEGKIILLPPLSSETHAALLQQLDRAETVNRADGRVMAKIVPLAEIGEFGFENANPVAVMFGDQVTLNNWRGPDTIGSSATAAFTLEWSAKQRLGHYYSAFVQVQTQDFQMLAGDDIQIWRWLFPPSVWSTADKVPDTHILKLPANLSPGAYRLVTGFYAYVDRRLPALTADGQLLGDSVTIGWIKVPQPKPPTIPADAVPVEATLADAIALKAFKVTPAATGDVQITLYWQALTRRPPFDATIFVHVLGQDGKTVAQQDARPWGGQYPTFIWDKDEVVQTDYTVKLPVNSTALTLNVGMYTFPGVVRLPVKQDGTVAPESIIQLGDIAGYAR